MVKITDANGGAGAGFLISLLLEQTAGASITVALEITANPVVVVAGAVRE